MTKTKKRFNVAVLCIVSLLLFVGTISCIRSYYRIPSGDEVVYRYVWEEDDNIDLWVNGHRFEREVTTLSEIIQTQTIHYFCVNGRSLVHAIEQAFTNHELFFSIINSVVFLLYVLLIVMYVTATKTQRYWYLLWLAVICGLLYLFPLPHSLWISINWGLNYLWPGCLSVLMLLFWEKIEHGTLESKWNVPLIISALIFGWTHEGFVVGVAGGTFLYYCFNFRKYRGQAIMMTVPMWLTACIMVFAPGNISRFFGRDGNGSPFYLKLNNGFDNNLHLIMIWLLVAGIIYLLVTGHKKQLKDFIISNTRLIYVFCVAFVFSMIANTAPYSHTFTELISMLLIFKYICAYPIAKTKYAKYLAVVLTVVFCTHQVIVAQDTRKVYEYQKVKRAEYINSIDGIVCYDLPHISPLSKRFIREWETSTFTLVYGKGKKTARFLSPSEFQALAQPEKFYIPANAMEGDGDVYKSDGGKYMWVKPEAMNDSVSLTAELYPVDWNHNASLLLRVKFALFPEKYENAEKLRVDTLDTRFGKAYIITPPLLRKIKAVNITSSK